MEEICSPKKNKYNGIAAIFVVVIGIYLLLKQMNVFPNIGVSDNVTYGFAFILGLVAAFSSCTATTGSLLLAVSSNSNHEHLTKYQKFKPHVYFNIGRIVSYTLLGGLLGILGSKILLSQTAVGFITIVVAITMILLGVQLLGVLPSIITLPKSIASKIFDAAEDKKSAPFLFGASTFFFPCGFTQALQLYVLAHGNFIQGAFTMLFFSLGTMPALISIGALSSLSKGKLKHHVTRIAGVIVIIFGIISIQSGFGLVGFSISNPFLNSNSGSAALETNGNQVIQMVVNGYSYSPSEFTIKKGVPVEWRIDGRNAAGCASVINVPKLSIMQRLQKTQETVITFTPDRTGKIEFSCSMWMAGPGAFNVI